MAATTDSSFHCWEKYNIIDMECVIVEFGQKNTEKLILSCIHISGIWLLMLIKYHAVLHCCVSQSSD
jgi:hypothetical protein